MDEGKYLTEQEIRKLRKVTKKAAEAAAGKGNKVAVRNWMIMDMAMSTGLRVKELAELKCGDFLLDEGRASVFVRNGKGRKPGYVRFGTTLRKHILEHLEWKRTQNENANPEAPFFTSSITGGHMTRRALQMAFKKCMERSGLRSDLGIHGLRHSYAVMLYKASGYNLRLVQRQMRHSSIGVTEVYAHVAEPDLGRALKRLFE